jgi:hypothetical protein
MKLYINWVPMVLHRLYYRQINHLYYSFLFSFFIPNSLLFYSFQCIS